METVTLGSTGIITIKNAMGCLPIQRDTTDVAAHIVRKAYESGFTFFDTARAYTDSETKVGIALHDVRDKVFIATKTAAKTADQLRADLETSLKNLQTDYIDIYQFHNPAFCPKPGAADGLYDAALEAKRQGKIRHIGITNHRLNIAKEAIESGLYETLQFPFNYLCTEKDLELITLCKQRNIGFIAMKSLSGGLINNAAAAYAFAAQYDNVLPIWGIQHEKELDEFIAFNSNPPAMTDSIRELIKKDREQLSGSFCRGCGYCMPCPQGIEINNCARMSLMIRRAPSAAWLGPDWQKKMERITSCVHCHKCSSHCPYGLDTPALLLENYKDYQEVLAGRRTV